MFFCDMFFVMTDIDFESYAYESTPSVAADNIEDVILLFKWFSDNQMKTNKVICYLTVGNNKHVSIKLDAVETENSNCKE